jgi:hypothetical protein
LSGYWPQTNEIGTAINPEISPGPPTGFGENFEAANSDMLLTNNSNSSYQMLGDAYGDRINDIYSKTGVRLDNPVYAAETDNLNVARQLMPGMARHSAMAIAMHRPLEAHLQDFEGKVNDLRVQHPDLTTGEDMWKNLGQIVKAQAAENANVNARATVLGKAGSVLGDMAGALQDPVNMVTLPFGAPASAGILKTAVLEAGIGGATEAVIQPGVQDFRGKLGLDAGVKQGLENVAAAAGGRALLATGIKGLGMAVDSAPGQMAINTISEAGGTASEAVQKLFGKKLLSMFDSSVPKPTPEQQLAREMYGEVTDVNSQSPLDPNNPNSLAEHNDRLLQATRALQGEQPLDLPEQPAAALSSKALNETPEGKGFIQAFDPAAIKTDAKTFQFKEGGDSAGVTDRLQGVKEWDPVKAGMVVVYEDEAGQHFIADGHQRLGLAQRLAAANPDAGVSLYGALFRASDGFTPESVRVIAAMKNIAEGTGSAVDAAKVLRVDVSRIKELPPRSALVRQAADMVNLTDNSFGFVVNDLVPANQAAIVGRLVKNAPELQDAIMNLLARLEPDNPAQAESIVRQAMEAGTHSETQHSLFGEETVTSSLYGERAKVLDKALKKLRLERKVFRTLVDNASRIEASGNVLNTEVNAARAETDGRAQQMVQTLANRKGPLSDALTAAARRAANEGRYVNATADFVDAVRSAAERGDFNGVDAGENGRAAEAADENGAGARPAAEAAPDETALEKFSEPNGPGAQEQTRALQADLVHEAAESGVDPAQPGLLDMAVPVAQHVDEAGNVVSQTKTVRQLFDELDQDAKDLQAISSCGVGK